jgi:subtilisin-like proprotein convertase family protein
MKIKLTLLGLVLSAAVLPAQALTNNYSLSPNAGIPDGSPVGLMETFNASGLSGAITNIQVTLDITGGFNGDLYAYLVGPQGQLAVLLNRPGITGANPFGYGDAGLNITLDGAAVNNIHGYGSGAYSTNGLGQVTGTFAADGRAINPQSLGTVFDGASTAANLSVFNTTDGNGAWTLFIADLAAGGGTANLNNVVLTIMTVPEPQTWVMLGGGTALFWLCRNRRNFRVVIGRIPEHG